MLLAVMTAKFKSTFSSSVDTIHITDKEVPSKSKADVWEYCATMLGVDISTIDITYSPNCS